MPKRQKLKAAKDAPKKTIAVHDRMVAELPFNAQYAVVEVNDAYGIPEGAIFDKLRREWVSPGQPKVKVIRNLRGDPLAAMREARQIDQVQYDAGDHWRGAYVRSEIGAVRAIDPTKEAVDGGRLAEPLNEVVSKAVADLAKASKALGAEGDMLVRDILGRSMTVAKAADARGLSSETGRKYVGRRFRECLDTLSVVFGYATKSAVASPANYLDGHGYHGDVTLGIPSLRGYAE